MIFRSTPTPLRKAFADFKRDLKATRWLRGLGWFVGVIWLLGLIASACTVGAMSTFISTDSACLPDGSFRLRPGTYSMWSSTGFFQITLGGGNLTFAKAKVVDIVWDIGVGRGGQVILALISWREFARYLTICMENEPVTYQVFRTIFIENDASVLSTCRTIRSFIWQRRLRSKVAMAFMTATMVFILAFPTLMSAMSGYDSNVSSRIPDRNDNLVPFDDFSRALYFVENGEKLNRSNNLFVTDNAYGSDPVLRYGGFSSSSLIFSLSLYVEAYGLGGQLNETSTFYNGSRRENITLDAPILNITAYTLDDPRLAAYNTTGALGMTWVKDGELFDKNYIETNGQCQNIGTYKWGFSFLQLFVCLLLLLGWTLGIYIMWIYTHYTLLLRNRLSEEVSGEHRAVLELAAAMQYELDIADIDVSLLREKQLDERIKKEIRGGTVAYAYPKSSMETHSIRKGIKQWWKKDKWWFTAFLFMSTFCSTFWMYALRAPGGFWLWMWLWSILFGQFWAFCIGTTTGSRLFVILVCSIAGALAVMIPAIMSSMSESYYY